MLGSCWDARQEASQVVSVMHVYLGAEFWLGFQTSWVLLAWVFCFGLKAAVLNNG